ncbi:MAG: 50S ribosomal protein L22 [Candidatus Bathyarchaeia archaeon]
MPSWKYSITGLDPDKTAIASGRDLRISPKHAMEVCRAIRGMMLDEAKEYLQKVIDGKAPVPYRRHKKKVGHRHELQGWYAGRYPRKASKEILKLLEGAEANAEFKGLNPERLRILHASSQKGRKIRNYIPRAFGRATPYFRELTHVEIALEEV